MRRPFRRWRKRPTDSIATILSEGRWTHDFPILVVNAKQLGLPVTTDMPRTVYDLMDLYPQGAKGRPSVLYVPVRPAPNTFGPVHWS